jgi:uncharacterized RDD family membrane protein YckC
MLLLAVYGVVNKNLLDAYHGPQAVADSAGAIVFYDDGPKDTRPQDRAFFLRKSPDGKRWDKPERVEGALVGAALRGSGELVCLYPDFFSVYDRSKKLEREWSGSTEAMGFQPRSIERMGDDVVAFGADADGTLLAARLSPSTAGGAPPWRFASVEGARLEKAVEPPGDASDKSEESAAASPVSWAGAQDRDGTFALLMRVGRRTSGRAAASGETAPGELRFARFDGTKFMGSSATVLDEDLTTLAAVAVTSSGAIAQVASSVMGALAPTPRAPGSAGVLASTAEVTTRVLVFGTRRADPEPRIVCFLLDGSRLVEVESIPYRRGGLFRDDQSVTSLAAAAIQGRILLFAQIGGSVKRIVWEHGKWGEWEDLARLPVEAMALVWGYLGSLLGLAGIMVVAAGFTLVKRIRVGVPGLREMDAATAEALLAQAQKPEARLVEPVVVASSEPAPDRSENDASIPDRFVAFGIDLAFVLGVAMIIREWLDWNLVAFLNDDPVRSLAIVAWLTLGLVAYLTTFEVLFGKTPGKHLLGLEVRGLAGERPPVLARLYRNLFRVELLFFATPIVIPLTGDQHLLLPVPVLALVVMVATPRSQRPGDLVAGTVVQRIRPPRTEAPGADEPQPATSGDEDELP